MDSVLELFEEYREVISVFNNAIWEGNVPDAVLTQWLNNFSDIECGDIDKQRLHALYLLTQIMYFGKKEIRHMLKYVFEHLYKYKIIRDIRKRNNDTADIVKIHQLFNMELEKTRFFGMGNPSESGVHLLYYFRQVNNLSSQLFIHAHQIFSRSYDADKQIYVDNIDENIRRYVFIDDFCGTGSQAKEYSSGLIAKLKAMKPDSIICYYTLFSTSHGKYFIKNNLAFDEVECVFELDDSFKCFSESSRFFIDENIQISKELCKKIALFYGRNLQYGPWGFGDSQAMLAFAHNTPDNTLPIFGSAPLTPHEVDWHPVFPRYDKNYGGLL